MTGGGRRLAWRLRRGAALGLGVVLAAACGHAGSSTATGTPEPAAPPSTVQPGVRAVSGTFYLGSLAAPAAGVEVWLFDQTAATLTRVILDASGAFSLPVSHFADGHVYSFHLVAAGRLLGDLALAAATPGGAAPVAFQYQGGYGFDLGQVVIPVDAHGEPVPARSGLLGQVGGGFSLAPQVDGTFAAFPVPAVTPTLQLGSQLLVLDAQTLLYSFYGRAAHPELYARDLTRLSRLGGVAVAAADDQVTRVFVTEAGPWLGAARQPAADDAPPEAAPLWAAQDYAFTKADKTHFAVSVFSGGLQPAGAIALLRVQPASGAESVVPLTPPRQLTFPPQVTAVSGAGGAAVAVDYTAASTANGLTLPFCQTGEVVLDVAPPLDAQSLPVPAATLNWVTVTVDWYQASAGQTVGLKVTADQLPAPYNAPLTDTALADVTRTWSPATMTVRFALGPTAAAAAAPELRLWPELFPALLGPATVSAFRLRVTYGSDGEATRGGLAVWFKKGC